MPVDTTPVRPGEDCTDLAMITPRCPAPLRWVGGALGVLVLAIGAYHAVRPAPLASRSAVGDGRVSVAQAWMRPTPTSTGAVYLTLRNDSGAPVLLTGVACAPAECMMHISAEHDGISTMRMLDSLTVPAHGEVAFKPGALHIMVTGLKAPLAEGAVFPLTLHFRTLSDLAVAVAVRTGAPQ